MTYRRPTTIVVLGAALACVAGLGCRAGRSPAGGAPTATPLSYGGVLDVGGVPVEGMRSITVRLWDAATGGTAACTTVSPTTAVAAGRWRVTLDDACAAAARANPNLWAEVIVDATTFPRAKVGAVPYALEAGRAAAPSRMPATRLAAVETAVRPHQVEVGTTTGLMGSPCSTGYQSAGGLTPLTFTAGASGTYRISATILSSIGSASSLTTRIGVTGSPSFLSQPEATTTLNGIVVPLAALVRLEAGRMYTATFEYRTTGSGSCSANIAALTPLVAEQLN